VNKKERKEAFDADVAKIREEMQQEERDAELRECVKEFFDKYLNRVEESDEGRAFSPITLNCCRVMMLEPLNDLLTRMAKLSGAKAKVTYEI
jgi:3'-phosphoadenosine 5'-phosphosulfate sulfotransferase (PAPS reductase)/FAD synthetase